MEPAKKELSFVFILLSVIIGGVIIFQWVLVNDLCSPSPAVLLQLGKFLRKAIMFRFLYVVLLAGLAFLFPVQKRRDESLKYVYTATTLVLAIALILGFSNVLSWYNLLVFPIVFIGFTILVIQTAGFYLKRHVVSDKSIFGISHEKSEFYFDFETVEGNLRIHKATTKFFILMVVRDLENRKAGLKVSSINVQSVTMPDLYMIGKEILLNRVHLFCPGSHTVV